MDFESELLFEREEIKSNKKEKKTKQTDKDIPFDELPPKLIINVSTIWKFNNYVKRNTLPMGRGEYSIHYELGKSDFIKKNIDKEFIIKVIYSTNKEKDKAHYFHRAKYYSQIGGCVYLRPIGKIFDRNNLLENY